MSAIPNPSRATAPLSALLPSAVLLSTMLLSAVLLSACAPVPAAKPDAAPAPISSQPFPGLDSPPLPSPPRPFNIDAPIEQRLPNGLRVVLAARPGVQLVTASLIVLSGSETDPAQRSGLASMTAGLLVKGTHKHSATALARNAESLGGTLDSGAAWHQSSLGITVTVPKLDEALALVAETVEQPAFAQAELDRLRAQTLDDLKIAYAQPSTLAAQASQRLVFGAGTYGHPASGTPGSLARITRADLVADHAAHYRPDNAVLLLAGDLDAAAALRLAARHFGGWRGARAGHSAAANAAEAVGAPLAPTTLIIDMPGSGQAAVVLASPLPPLGDQRAAAAVANAVLGGGYSSRLNQEIRVQRGLSYGADSFVDSRLKGAALRIGVQTKNESAGEVLALVQAQLDGMIATPIPDAELAARKATLIGDFSRSVETTAGLGATVRAMIVAGVPLGTLRTRIDTLGAVNAGEVQRFAATNFGASGRRVVIAGDASRFADSLKAMPNTLQLTATTLDLEKPGGLK